MLRRARRFWAIPVIWFAACLGGCSHDAPVYEPPPQFTMPSGADPEPEVRLLTLNDLDAKYAVLDGVDGAGSGEERKWTADRALFRFRVRSLAGSDLYMKYSVHDATFAQTGPVRITISVNGRAFDSFVKTAPGNYEYRHRANLIRARPYEPLLVSLAITPPYLAKEDQARLGILLTTIGFVPQEPEPKRR